MTLKNVKSEIAAVFNAFKKYGSARQLAITEKNNIVKECRESIATVHSANVAENGNREDIIKDAQEKAEKAGQMLKILQARMKGDYGKSWSRSLYTFVAAAEQEIVEAFSVLAIMKRQEIPSMDIQFRAQDPDSYIKTKTTVRVSYEAYVLGLLDCVLELKRVVLDSLDRSDDGHASDVFKTMHELFNMLERFMQFSNSVDGLKVKIDKARYQVSETRKLLK